MSPPSVRARRRPKDPPPADPLGGDFGPGPVADAFPTGPIPGLACAGDGCLLKPAANLLGKFTLRLSLEHGVSLGRAAVSGLELMKALRDFLDEEIELAERAGRRRSGGARRYRKIAVE